MRVSISMRVTVAELMSRAAQHVESSETLFIVGATMAYVGRLQACYEGRHAASPESARESRAALRSSSSPSSTATGVHAEKREGTAGMDVSLGLLIGTWEAHPDVPDLRAAGYASTRLRR